MLPIVSTYLSCLINTYAVHDRTEELRRGSRLSARPRSLEGTLAQRHRGAFRGRALPNREIVPPKRGLCPEKINRLGAIAVQFEAKILVITLEFVGKNCFFVDFAMNINCLCGLTPGFLKSCVHFARKTFFFFGLHRRSRGNSHVFAQMKTRISGNSRIVWNKDLFFLFFGLHLRICGNSR